MEKGFPLLFSPHNLENMRIILLGDKPVAHIGLSVVEAFLYGCRLKIGMVGAVGTHPGHRGKGLAGTLLSDCMRKLLLDGVDFVMISGIRSLYDRAGCAMAGRAYPYELTAQRARKALKRPAMGCGIREFDPSQLDELIPIYEAEPVRYLRTREEFATLLGEEAFARPKTFLLKCGGETAAYVCVETRWDEDALRIVEFAGSRAAIISAIPQLLKRLNVKALRLMVPHQDHELLGMLSPLGRPRPSNAVGTMRILNPKGLLEKLRPHLASLAGEHAAGLSFASIGGCPSFVLDGERLALEDEKALTWLLFGQPEEVEERFHRFLRPFSPQCGGELAGIISRALPLPTFLYGLNYT